MSKTPPRFTAELYTAFAGHARPRNLPQCMCCMDQRDVEPLITLPLEALVGPHFRTYVDAVNVHGPADYGFGYYLPRLLELEALSPSQSEPLGEALAQAGWDNFSSQQRSALVGFVRAATASIGDEFGTRALRWKSWLCLVSHVSALLTASLAELEHHPQALQALAKHVIGELRTGRPFGIYWERSPGQETVRNWLKSAAVQDHLPLHLRTW